ncbi:hypothetical protein FQR65_LT16008 [Abscondita terminalis]|nr:hypothetical protein FQR65_LT16008 [Abscondita terminalis]
MFDTEKFIVHVQARECLWKISCAEYNNRDKKIKCWQEVCAEMFEEWETLDAATKRDKGIDLQKKWKNLKDRFMKDVRAEKEVRSGNAASKKKKYVYSEIMQFLMPQMERRRYHHSQIKTESNVQGNEADADAVVVGSDNDDVHEEDNNDVQTPTTVSNHQRKVPKSTQKQTFENKLLQILENRETQQEDDEDLAFFKSILPSVKKLTDIQKTEFRLDVLNSLKKAQTFNIYGAPPNMHHIQLHPSHQHFHQFGMSTLPAAPPYIQSTPSTARPPSHFTYTSDPSSSSSSFQAPSPADSQLSELLNI